MAKRMSRGFVLILVIFVMLVFGILGWTLAVMQAGNLGSSLRSLQDKQALYLAEAGAQWGLSDRIKSGLTSSSDTDCLDANDWVNHTLPPGQYRVCTRPALAAELADVVIESVGCVPSVNNCTSNRQIKISAYLGSFDKAVKTSGTFNWNVIDRFDRRSSYVAGDMLCAYYNSDGDGVFNEWGPNSDYYVDDKIGMPRTNRETRGARRDIGSGELPSIDMQVYEHDANATILVPGMTTTIANITLVDGDTHTQINVTTPDFFGALPAYRTQWVGQGLRNIAQGSWRAGTWMDILRVPGNITAVLNGTVNWTVDDRVTIEPVIAVTPVYNTARQQYNVTVNCSVGWPAGQAIRNFGRGWEYTDWGIINSTPVALPGNVTNITIQMVNLPNNPPLAAQRWQAGQFIGMVRRFSLSDWDHEGDLLNNDRQDGPKVLYIESDVLFDVRDAQIKVLNVGVVVEGDSVIRGEKNIKFTKWPQIYPNLATKNGNIYSPDKPSNDMAGRNFDDVIFSQNGDIIFNYLDVKAVYGHNVTLTGDVMVQYDPDLEHLDGYSFGTSGVKWKEQ
jgi:hypothetical protein